MGYFPKWKLKTDGIIGPDERLPASQMAALGIQHVVAMFGSTILAPLLMGFDPNVAVLMSGIGTLIFFLIVGGRVPSYLGSSFAFIGVLMNFLFAACCALFLFWFFGKAGNTRHRRIDHDGKTIHVNDFGTKVD